MFNMKPYWFNKRCCVPECFNSSTEGEGCYKEFFDLPAEPQSRGRWLKAIISGDGEDLKICEDHFKDDDLFRDKNHRKKLRLNSIPSMKLPQNICTVCLGSTRPPKHSDSLQPKMCQCIPAIVSVVVPTSPEKRMRLTWTAMEKRTLFRAVKKHGDVKLINNHVRINWSSVLSYCRDNGCFGNEKELKSAWQYLRLRAAKVYRDEIYGTKLERKVSRFLYGKGPKLHRLRQTNIDIDGSLLPTHMDTGTTDDELNEEQMSLTADELEQQLLAIGNNNEEEEEEEQVDIACANEGDKDTQIDPAGDAVVEKDTDPDTGNGTCESESENEHYSAEDVERKLGIKIISRPPVVSSEVIWITSDSETE